MKIARAEEKASAPQASRGDRLAAAAAYLERANAYRDAASPTLYKHALGDYRRALRYDPANAEARAKLDELVSIYRSLGRPVPDNGGEPAETLALMSAGARRIEVGAAAGTLKGEVEKGGTGHVLFRAEAGKYVTVRIETQGQAPAHFNLYRVKDGVPVRVALGVEVWSWETKEAGEYVVRIGPAREKHAYAVEVSSGKAPETRKF